MNAKLSLEMMRTTTPRWMMTTHRSIASSDPGIHIKIILIIIITINFNKTSLLVLFPQILVTGNNGKAPGRQRIPVMCGACGTFGHEATRNGCDLTAQVLLILRFIKREPQAIKHILQKHKEYQEYRKKNSGSGSKLSERFKAHAKARNYGATPRVHALFDILGDTLEDLDEHEGTVAKLTDQDDSLQEDDSAAMKEVEAFYDTSEAEE